MKILYGSIGLGLLAAGCMPSASRVASVPLQPVAGPATVVGMAPPSAVVYRTSSELDDRVSVTLDASGTSVVSYPDPADVRALGQRALPLRLAGGYLLDRRGGISRHTAFLDYTYAEYSRLSSVPSATELFGRVAVRDAVTEIHILPFTLAVAEADTARCNALVRSGFPGCRSFSSAVPPLSGVVRTNESD